MKNNRVTLLTARGSAGIAVVRLAGPGIDLFLQRHFSKPVSNGKCVHGNLLAGDRVIDDAIVVRQGQIVDLNIHGGTWVTRLALELAQSAGFTPVADIADDDGSSPSAVLWREVLAALPFAVTEQAVRMLLAQPTAWENINANAADILADTSGKWLVHLPRVATVGPANVGKSTLANQLFGRARSITADVPGTTRDWVGEIANLDGLAVMLLDTPGTRSTNDAIEAAAIAGSRSQIESADLVVLVLDQSLRLDAQMLTCHPNALVVANKCDAPAAWNACEIGALQTSATNGHGIDHLRAEIRRRFGWEPVEIERARWWTPRQYESLRRLNNSVAG